MDDRCHGSDKYGFPRTSGHGSWESGGVGGRVLVVTDFWSPPGSTVPKPHSHDGVLTRVDGPVLSWTESESKQGFSLSHDPQVSPVRRPRLWKFGRPRFPQGSGNSHVLTGPGVDTDPSTLTWTLPPRGRDG